MGAFEILKAKFGLSQKEVEVVEEMMRDDIEDDQLLKTLSITKNTLNNHLKRIYQKTNVKNKFELVKMVLKKAAPVKSEGRQCALRMLIIDDEEEIAESIADHFEEKGMITHYLTECEDIEAAVLKFYPDVIVLDIRLNGPDGTVLLKNLREKAPVSPKVVFITGYSSHKENELLEFGASDLLHKPFKLDLLENKVMKLFGVEEVAEDDGIGGIKSYEFTKGSLGTGGAFIGLSSEEFAEAPKNKGQRFNLTLDFGYIKISDVLSEVVWSRAEEQSSYPIGIGVRFLKPTLADKKNIQRYCIKSHVKAHIPIA